MPSDKYGVEQDPACYPGTSLLKNLLNIENQPDLDEAEQELSLIRADTWEPDFSLNKLKRIH